MKYANAIGNDLMFERQCTKVFCIITMLNLGQDKIMNINYVHTCILEETTKLEKKILNFHATLMQHI